MALLVKTTGLEQYAPGGTARVKVLIIGGPGAGKTRWSSFFPKPIYGDCEAGLASVADREVPYVSIKTSGDMLELLKYLKIESTKPDDQRKYQTVIIDTLDAFQRKVMDEWLAKNPNAGGFKGYDAWGFLDQQMQMLMTRLLNLDMNVIVNVHYKEIKGGEDEPTKLGLQLAGGLKDTAFNDFDFVGWMGTYWANDKAEDGQRLQKRGLTFRATPERPFLKDRLHITPVWLDVNFDDDDYLNLFRLIAEKSESLSAGREVDVIEVEKDATTERTSNVVTPGTSGTGALPPVDPREVPLESLDKPALLLEAQQLHKDGKLKVAPKSNMLKAELITLVRQGRAAADSAPESATPDPAPAVATPVETAPPAEPVETVAAPDVAEPVAAPVPSAANVQKTQDNVIVTPQGVAVNPTTGEVFETNVPEDEAISMIESVLGGDVISIVEEAEAKTPAPAPAPVATPAPAPAAPAAGEKTCADCGKSLENESPDFVRLSFIKNRRYQCEADYKASKKS